MEEKLDGVVAEPSIADKIPAFGHSYRRAAIPSCVIDVEDLLVLSQRLRPLACRARDRVLDSRTPATEEERLVAALRNKDPLLVYVEGMDGDQRIGAPEDVFRKEKLPDKIRLIHFDSHTALKEFFTAPDRFLVVLDLSEPQVLYGYQPWEDPTPNNSRIEVIGPDTTWSTAVQTKALSFFQNRQAHRNWLHKPTTFNVLQLLVAWPGSLWLAFTANEYLASLLKETAPVWQAVVIVYVTLLSLVGYRVIIVAFSNHRAKRDATVEGSCSNSCASGLSSRRFLGLAHKATGNVMGDFLIAKEGCQLVHEGNRNEPRRWLLR